MRKPALRRAFSLPWPWRLVRLVRSSQQLFSAQPRGGRQSQPGEEAYHRSFHGRHSAYPAANSKVSRRPMVTQAPDGTLPKDTCRQCPATFFDTGGTSSAPDAATHAQQLVQDLREQALHGLRAPQHFLISHRHILRARVHHGRPARAGQPNQSNPERVCSCR